MLDFVCICKTRDRSQREWGQEKGGKEEIMRVISKWPEGFAVEPVG